jgi:hypothetical protein
MRLRTQLIVAFLLLAVVPLAAVTLMVYDSSTRAYRQAVEEEAVALTQEMTGRMESMRADMNQRISQLGSFPFGQLMALRDQNKSPEQSRALMGQLMSQMGDSAPFIDSFEFVPAGLPPVPSRPVPLPPGQANRTQPPLTARGGPDAVPGPGRGWHMVLQLGPELQQKIDRNRERLKEMESADPARNPDYRIVVEEIRKSTEALKSMEEAEKIAAEARKNAFEALNSRPAGLQPGADIGLKVTDQGQLVGQVVARLRSASMYRSILARGRRRPSDIPFAVDAEGNMHTADLADQPKLAALNIARGGVGVKTQTLEAARRDWGSSRAQGRNPNSPSASLGQSAKDWWRYAIQPPGTWL